MQAKHDGFVQHNHRRNLTELDVTLNAAWCNKSKTQAVKTTKDAMIGLMPKSLSVMGMDVLAMP